MASKAKILKFSSDAHNSSGCQIFRKKKGEINFEIYFVLIIRLQRVTYLGVGVKKLQEFNQERKI